MQDLIDELLDNALENGHDHTKIPAIDVAEDMVQFSPDVENEKPEDLVPYIENWQQKKRQ